MDLFHFTFVTNNKSLREHMVVLLKAGIGDVNKREIKVGCCPLTCSL